MHNAPCITSVRELGGAELRAGSGRSQKQSGCGVGGESVWGGREMEF